MVHFFCCFYYQHYALFQYLSLQVLIDHESFAAEFPQFVPRSNCLFLSNHLLLGYCVFICLQRPLIFSRKYAFSYHNSLMSLSCWSLCDFTLPSAFSIFFSPSFLDLLQHLSLARLFLFLAHLTWCYYLWFPKLTDLFGNLFQPPHVELWIMSRIFCSCFRNMSVKISFTSSTDMLAHSVVQSCLSALFGISITALVSLFTRSTFFLAHQVHDF